MGLSHVLRNPLKRVGILGVWLDQINGLWKNISQRQTLFIENAEKYFEKTNTLHILVVVGLRCVRFRLENEALQHDYGYCNFDKIFSDLGNHVDPLTTLVK